MNRLKSLGAAAAISVMGSASFAVPIDTTGYTSTNLETLDGFALYDVENGFFAADTIGFEILLGSFLPFADTDADLDYIGFTDILTSIQVSAMTESVQFLFEDGMTRYLLDIDASGNGADFLDTGSFAFSDVEAQITLDRLDLDNLNVIPLPAGLPLMLSGVACFAWLRRKKNG